MCNGRATCDVADESVTPTRPASNTISDINHLLPVRVTRGQFRIEEGATSIGFHTGVADPKPVSAAKVAK